MCLCTGISKAGNNCNVQHRGELCRTDDPFWRSGESGIAVPRAGKPAAMDSSAMA